MMPRLGDFCWSELLTFDIKKAKDFYTSVLGWEAKDLEVGNEPYVMLMSENKGFGGIMKFSSDKENITSHWISYIAVKDLSETLEKAKKFGASILKPVTLLPEKGRFAIITDPTGATIAFWESFLRT